MNKLLTSMIVVLGFCVIAGSGYQFGRHLAGKDSKPATQQAQTQQPQA